MKALVIYESMYGNTHLIAESIAEGLRSAGSGVEVDVTAVDGATSALVAAADLVVAGGPTHAHGMSRASTRQGAVEAAADPAKQLTLDPDAEGDGLREWFDQIDRSTARAAAFDTRVEGPTALTGRASKGIAKRFRHGGFDLIAEPESFLVSRDNHLLDHERDHAAQWGRELGTALQATLRPSADHGT